MQLNVGPFESKGMLMTILFLMIWFLVGWMLPEWMWFISLGLIGIYGLNETISILKSSTIIGLIWFVGSAVVLLAAWIGLTETQGLEVLNPQHYEGEEKSFMLLTYLSAGTGAGVGVLIGWMRFCDWVMYPYTKEGREQGW